MGPWQVHEQKVSNAGKLVLKRGNIISVTGARFFSLPCWAGLMTGLPGFASHGSDLHLQTGCE